MRAADIFLGTLAGFMLFGLIAFAFLTYTDTPDVIFSYSTGECRRVDLPDGSHGDCAHLPERYNHVWGK